MQNLILFLIIPSISSSLAKQQIERGTKQKQNSTDSIEQGIKFSWNRMILRFCDKRYDTGFNTELPLLPGLMPYVVLISFCTRHSTVCSWQRHRTIAHRGPKQHLSHSHLVPPLLVLQLALSPNNCLNHRAVKVGKNDKDVPLMYF